jgi:hypothetical protein
MPGAVIRWQVAYKICQPEIEQQCAAPVTDQTVAKSPENSPR